MKLLTLSNATVDPINWEHVKKCIAYLHSGNHCWESYWYFIPLLSSRRRRCKSGHKKWVPRWTPFTIVNLLHDCYCRWSSRILYGYVYLPPKPFVFNVVDVVLLPLPPPQILVYSSAVGMSESNYRSGTVNSNTVNSKFHLIRSFCEIFARFLSFHV